MAGNTVETFVLEDGQKNSAVIRVIGVGGGGSNTVEHMHNCGVEGVDLICANTDRKHLEGCSTASQIQLGALLTKGLGAGSIADVGRLAAEEDRERIAEIIKGTDLLFITSGMGGGTGTGAAPVIAAIAREMNILTVGVVTKPFASEGKKRVQQANEGINRLAAQVDSLIVIPNDKLKLVLGGGTSLIDAFGKANDVLKNAVIGITDLITRPGLISMDFADVRTVMSSRGMGMMGLGVGTGSDRAKIAVDMALASPLLDDIEIRGAQGLLVNITCDASLSLEEHELIMNTVGEIGSEDADIKCGNSFDPNLNGELRVTVVATGLPTMRRAEEATSRPMSLVDRPNPGMHNNGYPRPISPNAVASGPVGVPSIPNIRPTEPRGSMAPPNLSDRFGAGRGHGNAAVAANPWLMGLNEDELATPAYLRKQAD